MKRVLLLLLITIHFGSVAYAASPVDRIEPAFWWTGMKYTRLQILLHGKGIGGAMLSLGTYPGVSLSEVKKVRSPNYLFVYLEISAVAQPGKLSFTLAGMVKGTVPYELKARDNRIKAQGYTPADVIYLIMPDRFANGNPTNDSVKGMLEKPNRKPAGGPYLNFTRHGGDIEGITQHLDYFTKLGVTGLWLNPVQENDMKESSYHGYAITDFYAVDRRFGGMKAYQDLIVKAHGQGLKIVMDMVMNHMGTNHYWFKDMPDSSFINFWPKYTASNFRATAQADPYASEYDRNKMIKGWFAPTMGDINEQNPLVADYMIQTCIWWVEHTCIDDIRMDTYPYPDKNFMNQWASALTAEYPKLNLVGEVWVDNVGLASYFVKNKNKYGGYDAKEPTIMDFPLRDAIVNGLNDAKPDYTNGIVRVYNTLALDYLYDTPGKNMVFVNNHDMSRTATALKEDTKKVRQALAILLTTRGVPQLYYGEEWFMTGDGAHHPAVRRDFPGGWAGDSVDFFTGRNAGALHRETFETYTKLLNWRKTSTAVHRGKLTQFVPEDHVYVYFRHEGARQVMVVINEDKKEKELKLERFAERLQGSRSGTEVLTGAMLDLTKALKVDAQGVMVIDIPSRQP